MSDPKRRTEICKSLGLRDPFYAHAIIQSGAKKEPQWLLQKGLDASVMKDLGYEAAGMKNLGYSESALVRLGYDLPCVQDEEDMSAEPDGSIADRVQAFIAKGYRASELKQEGIAVRHCREAGIPPREIHRLGYPLEDLVGEFRGAELRTIGFGPRELSRFFPGPELRRLGFSAPEMRLAGYSVRDLLNFAYNENHIITAGYSVNELVREGLSKRVTDKRSLHHP